MGLVARGCMYCEGKCTKECIPKEEPNQDYSGVHFRHCYQGEYEDGCKYGEHDCPAKPKEEQLPTTWFKTEQIETWIGESITADKPTEEIQGGRGKLIVLHQCGENKEELISQLNTMIDGLKNGFEYFAQ